MEQLSSGLSAVKVGNCLPDQRAHEMEMLVAETVLVNRMRPFGEEWRGLNGDPRAVSDQGETCRGEMV